MRSIPALIVVLVAFCFGGVAFSVDVAGCQEIVSSDSYVLTANLSGANQSVTEMSGISYACIKISSSDVTLDCNGHTITNNGTLDATGIFSHGSAGTPYTNVTVKNCPSISGYEMNLIYTYTHEGLIQDVDVTNSTTYGFYLYQSDNTTFVNNTGGYGTRGFYAYYSDGTNLTDNVMYNHTEHGFRLYYSHYNTLHNNTAFNITSYDEGFHLQNSVYNNITNNTAYDSYYGFYIYTGSDDNNIFNNTAYGGYHGFNIRGRRNQLIDNVAYNNYYGAIVYGMYNNLTSNTAHDNEQIGFYLSSASYNNLTNNLAYGQNNSDGFFNYKSTYIRYVNNTAYGNGWSGFRIRDDADYNEFINNTAYSNDVSGFYIEESRNITTTNMHLYDNAQYDFYVFSPYSELAHNFNFIIDNPNGNYEAYTNLTINDSLASGEYYSVKWNDVKTPLPNQRIPFADKFINISNESATAVSIDSIVWQWKDSEISGADNESAFELWKHSGSWSNLTGAVLNTTANTFTLTNHNPASVYVILQEGESACTLINSSGNYKIYSNVSGAPIDAPGGKACINIAASNVIFDCKGNSITNNGTAGTTYGIALNGSVSNVTLRNCDLSGYTYGVYAPDSDDVTLTSINAYNNTDAGVYVSESNSTLSASRLYDNGYDLLLNNSGGSGSMTLSMSNALFLNPAGSLENYTNLSMSDSIGAGEIYSVNWTTNSTGLPANYSSFNEKFVDISNQSATAVSIDSITWHWLQNETSGVNEHELELWKNNGSWSNTNATLDHGANTLTLTNYNPASTYGLLYSIVSSCMLISSSNTYTWVFNSLQEGGLSPPSFAGKACIWVNASNATVDCNGYSIINPEAGTTAGVYIESPSRNVTLKNCDISNYTYGIYLDQANDSLFTNNTVYNNSVGIHVADGSGNTFSNNTARNNSQHGFHIDASLSANFMNNTAYGNTNYGFYLDGSVGQYLLDNTAYDNERGLYIFESNVTADDSTLYSNDYDLYASANGNSSILDVNNALFLNPSGTLENYTNLSIDDVLSAGERYMVNWTTNSTAPPEGEKRYGFNDKYLDISVLLGSPVVDSIVWHWTDSETAGYNEDYLEIWRYNFNWTERNATLNTGANTLTLTNHTPVSTYAIFWYDKPICRAITSPGNYTLSGNLEGAPISSSPAFGFTCIKISASNVVFDCNGYNITNNETPANKRGILIIGSATNVTVKNCPSVSGYQFNVDVSATGGNRITNVTAHNGTYGIRIGSFGANGNNVTGCTAYNTSNGIAFMYADNNTARDSIAYNNSQYGFYFNDDDFSVAINNTAYNNTYDGLYSYSSTFGTFVNNTAYDNDGDGFDFVNPTSNNITNNVAYDNSGEGFYLHAPVLIFSYNVLVDNWAYNNSLNGFYIYHDSHNTLYNNTAEDNGRNGFLVNGTLTGGGPEFSDNRFFNNTGRNNGWNGFHVLNETRTNLTNDVSYGNSQYGLYVDNSNNTRTRNVHTYDNDLGALYVRTNATNTTAISFAGFIVDNPAGNLQNYTNLSIGDYIEAGTAYSINWSDNSSGATAGLTPFRNKYVNISNATSGVSIDAIVWHWLDSETAGYNESKFQVWRYSGSWSSAGAARNTTANTLTVTNHNPASIYAMFESNISGCIEINGSGVYTLNDSATGAPFNNSCIRITADDVVFDCNNRSITGNGDNDTCGISIEGPVKNISIQNCPDITNFGIGICMVDVNGSKMENVGAKGNTQSGGKFEGCHGSAWQNCHFDDNDNHGAEIGDSSGFTASQGSTFNGNGNDGMHLDTGTGFNCIGCSFNNNDNDGADISGSSSNLTFDYGNTFNGNGEEGLSLDSSTYATIDDADLSLNGGYGILITYGFSVTINDVNSDDNDDGGGFIYQVVDLSISAASPSTFCGGLNGIIVNSSNNTLIDDSLACNNTQYGIYVVDSENTTINNSRTYNNAVDLKVENTLGSPVTLNVTSLKFDRPAGDLQDYTDMYFDDSVGASTSYTMNWTANSSGLPGNSSSFEDKFVDISGTGPIESVVWQWTDDESVGKGYDESVFDIWEYDGSWTEMNASLDTGANTLSLSNLAPSSEYGILGSPSNITTIDLFGMNVTNVTDHARFNGTTAGNISTEGGNLSGLNINASQLTDRWAAFYGDVLGSVLLAGATGSGYVYSWNWSPSDGGVVCVTTNSSFATTTVLGANGTNIDTAWNLTSNASDSGANTFSSANCTLGIGSESVANSSYADTGPAGEFITCAIKTVYAPTKPQMLFCSRIISGGTFWNGGTGDYELMVPTPEGAGTETYYFYANLGG